jgi:hypothetical protein
MITPKRIAEAYLNVQEMGLEGDAEQFANAKETLGRMMSVWMSEHPAPAGYHWAFANTGYPTLYPRSGQWVSPPQEAVSPPWRARCSSR